MNLDEIWEIATMPEYSDISGQFDVKILSGIFRLWALRFKTWRKQIGYAAGINIQNGKKDGYFAFWQRQKAGYMLFDYDVEVNSGSWLLLNDHVRKVTNDYFIGKIYFKFLGKYRYCGFFSLERIEGV